MSTKHTAAGVYLLPDNYFDVLHTRDVPVHFNYCGYTNEFQGPLYGERWAKHASSEHCKLLRGRGKHGNTVQYDVAELHALVLCCKSTQSKMRGGERREGDVEDAGVGERVNSRDLERFRRIVVRLHGHLLVPVKSGCFRCSPTQLGGNIQPTTMSGNMQRP